MESFWLCFVPLFVAVDAIGVLPIFMGLTEGMSHAETRRVIWQSVVTAMIVALLFLAIGKFVLNLLGITVADFMIAGGTLLFVISMGDLLAMEKVRRTTDLATVGAVPIGVPLIVGPAVLTTTMLLVSQHGVLPTVAATVFNIAIAGAIFWFSEAINRVLGSAGAKTISKLASLLLASIAVMMVRKGVVTIFSAIAAAKS